MSEISALYDKAQRFLQTAQLALETGDTDSCVSRSYYAMFFMAESALLSEGVSANSHKAVLSLFGQHFIQNGRLERHLGRHLHEAYDKRLLGDYGVETFVSEDEAREVLENARVFVERVAKYLGLISCPNKTSDE